MEGKKLYDCLKLGHSDSVSELRKVLMDTSRKLLPSLKISREEMEELIHDAILLFLEKIKGGLYIYNGKDPKIYVILILRNLIKNHLRKTSYQRCLLNQNLLYELEDAGDIARSLEIKNEIHFYLQNLNEPSSEILRLHYLEGYSDEEVVLYKMSTFTTVNSLKSKRCQVLKKLRILRIGSD